jgi:hypothetical protein
MSNVDILSLLSGNQAATSPAVSDFSMINTPPPATPPTDAGQGGDSLNQQIAALMAHVKPDYASVDSMTAEDPDARRKRLIGTLIAGGLGALANRGTQGGGLAGFAAAGSGYNNAALHKQDQTTAIKARMLEDAQKQQAGIYEHVVPKLMEIKAKREAAASGTEHLPEKVKAWLFRSQMPTDQQGGFDQFYNPEKASDPLKDVYTKLSSGEKLSQGETDLLKYHAGTSGLQSIAQNIAFMGSDQSPQKITQILKVLQGAMVPGGNTPQPAAPLSNY